MSPVPDDPPSEPQGPEAPAAALDSVSSQEVPAGDAPASAAPLRRRRRRRRRPVRAAAAGAEAAAAPHDEGSEPAAVAADGDTAPLGAAAAPGDSAAAAPERPRRRRRRRRPPNAGEATAAVTGDTAAPGPSDRPAAPTGPAGRPRRRRPPRPAAAAAPAAADAEALQQAAAARRHLKVVEIRSPWGHPSRPRRPPREAAAGGEQTAAPSSAPPPAQDRATRERQRAAGGSGRAAGRDGRDRKPSAGPRSKDRRAPRGEAPKRVEQKLYATRAVVDHGFEDIAEAEDAGATRRVMWTIVKRTLVDQTAGKPKSAVYVLERDGVDTEFPNLGAARAAVNKTIVHPEKLTRSKAEHAAERAGAKK